LLLTSPFQFDLLALEPQVPDFIRNLVDPVPLQFIGPTWVINYLAQVKPIF
jgi:hypothetical protein